jgi:mannitol/fructose-specific phosphotransferase system IIA component (Ntr-type)
VVCEFRGIEHALVLSMMNSSHEIADKSTLTLADYTSVALIIPQFHDCIASAVMRDLTEALRHEDAAVPDHPLQNLAALNQELLTGLSLDFGAAFPKLRVSGLKGPRFALGRSTEPLPWRATWLPPIQLVFLVVESPNYDTEQRQLRATLLRLGKHRLRIDQLLNARDVKEMLAVLDHFPVIQERLLTESQSLRAIAPANAQHVTTR